MRESSHHKRSIASSNRRGRSAALSKAGSRARSTATRVSKKAGSKNAPRTPPTLLTLGKILDAMLRLDGAELLKMASTFAQDAADTAEKAVNPDTYINMCIGQEENTDQNTDAYQKTFKYSEARDPMEEGVIPPLPNNLDPMSPNFLQPDSAAWVPTSIAFVPGRDDVSLDLTWFGPEVKMQMRMQQQMKQQMQQQNYQTLGEFLENSKHHERLQARRHARSASRSRHSRHRRTIPTSPSPAAVPAMEKSDETIKEKSDDTVKAETKDVMTDLKNAETARTTPIVNTPSSSDNVPVLMDAQSQSNSGSISQTRSSSRSDQENLSSDTTQESTIPTNQNGPLRVKVEDPDSNNIDNFDDSDPGSMRTRSGIFRIFNRKESSLHKRSIFSSSPKSGQAKKESSLHRRTAMFLSRHRRKSRRKEEGRPPMKPLMANQ